MDPLKAYVLAEHLMQDGVDTESYRKPSGQEQLEDPDTINGDVQTEGANVGDAVGCNDIVGAIVGARPSHKSTPALIDIQLFHVWG